MDHIMKLPKSGEEQFDAILVVMDQLMKQAIFIPCHVTDDTPTFTKLFIQHVFSKHGLLADIISDCGALFISQFWQELCQLLDVCTNLSTAYHPQTDRQTKCINQEIKQYLKVYINFRQNN